MYYPVFLDIRDKTIVVIGGGAVAYRKIKDLLKAGAKVRLISPEIIEKIEKYSTNENHKERIEYNQRKYKTGDLKGASLVFSATNDSQVNREVFKEAEKLNLFCNAVDDIPNCSMILPSVLRKKTLQVAISTSGKSPSMAARLKREMEKKIPENIDEILDCLGEGRDLLKNGDIDPKLTTEERGEILKEIVKRDRKLKRMLKSYRKNRLVSFLKKCVKK